MDIGALLALLQGLLASGATSGAATSAAAGPSLASVLGPAVADVATQVGTQQVRPGVSDLGLLEAAETGGLEVDPLAMLSAVLDEEGPLLEGLGGTQGPAPIQPRALSPTVRQPAAPVAQNQPAQAPRQTAGTGQDDQAAAIAAALALLEQERAARINAHFATAPFSRSRRRIV